MLNNKKIKIELENYHKFCESLRRFIIEDIEFEIVRDFFNEYKKSACKNKFINEKNINELLRLLVLPNIKENRILFLKQFVDIQNQYLALGLNCFKGLAAKRIQLLHSKNIKTLKDLIFTFPKFYYFADNITLIKDLKIGSIATVQGVVQNVKFIKSFKSNKSRLEILLKDDTGFIKLVQFNALPYAASSFIKNSKIIVTGRINFYNGKQIIPIYYFKLDENLKVITKYYIEDISDKLISNLIKQSIEFLDLFYIDLIPKDIIVRHNIFSFIESIKSIHFPKKISEKKIGLTRFIYEEFLNFQISLQYKKYDDKFIYKKYFYNKSVLSKLDDFIYSLPFKLTNAQLTAINEIKSDMVSNRKMNRLVQGDVGSGKTVVAAVAVMLATLSKFQSAVMAPTAILANQHYQTFKKLFANSGMRISLLTGNNSLKEKSEICQKLNNGEIDLIIGTHSLLQENVNFQNIKLAIIDEQHKFGVNQREELIKKGVDVDILMLSATPIPRTLTISIFGDLDVSVIDEMPANRKPVRTFVRREKDKINIFNFVKNKIKYENYQVFIVCPLIEASEKIDLKNAEEYFRELSCFHFKEFNCALIHSKIQNKDEIMQLFREKKINILVCTTVIEVGVDIPDANIMIIEDAQRFGLSQLHQLRGRIGRSDKESFCILIIGNNITELAEKRIKTMEKYSDGFKISEIDLYLRGTGEILGLKQSGLSEFQFGHILKNKSELLWAFYDAKEILKRKNNCKENLFIELSLNKFQDKVEKIFV